MERNLDVRFFRNGDPIQESITLEDFYEFQMKFEPTYYMVNIGNEKHYFYNGWAAIDTSIAPIGYKVPSRDDFKFLKSQDYLKFKSLGFIDLNEFISSSNYLYFWTSSRTKDTVNYIDALLIDLKTIKKYPNIPMNCSNGLSIRCIEDLDYSIKTKSYDYKLLLPDKYNLILEKLILNLKSQYSFSNSEVICIKGNIGFSRDGFNKSIITDIDPFYSNLKEDQKQKIKLNLTNELNSFNEFPIYNNQLIESQSNFSLVLKYTDTILKRQEFKSSFTTASYKILPSHVNKINQAYNNGFKCKLHQRNLKVNDNGNLLYNEETLELIKFRGKGPIISLGAIIPGMGLSLITKNSFNTKGRQSLKKTLWISGLTLGLVSVSSKIYSKHYYNRYTSDLLGNNAEKNYKNANISQKIFLSSLIGYGVLSAVDFTVTFGIGTKNKFVEKKLNSELKRDKKIILY